MRLSVRVQRSSRLEKIDLLELRERRGERHKGSRQLRGEACGREEVLELGRVREVQAEVVDGGKVGEQRWVGVATEGVDLQKELRGHALEHDDVVRGVAAEGEAAVEGEDVRGDAKICECFLSSFLTRAKESSSCFG